MRLRPARCCRHFVEPKPFIQHLACKTLIPCTLIPDLIPLAEVYGQPLLYMPFYVRKGMRAITVMEVARPAPEGGVDLFYYHVKRLRRHPSVGHGGDAVLDFLQGLS